MVDEDSLYETLRAECLQACARLKDAGAFLSLASSNPSVYLGAASAKAVPEAGLETAIALSICDVRECQDPIGTPGMGRWARLMVLDGLIAETARLHALVRRYGELNQVGPKQSIQDLYWLVMGGPYPSLPRGRNADQGERR